jgi:cytidylate kinase
MRGEDLPRFFCDVREDRRVNVPVIAIDGPSASGKGTIAKRVAQALGFNYLESGALYRLVALLALRRELQDEQAIAEAAAHMDVAFQGDEIFLEDQEVSLHIRHEEGGNRASEVARMPAVRQALLTRQRAFRQPPGLVADGRDMGTIVFPDAALKIFLTANPEVRAQRRYKQLIEKGIAANLGALSRDLAERDARDASRAVAPLVPAPDSQVLDSSALSVEAVVDQILRLWRERILGGRGPRAGA